MYAVKGMEPITRTGRRSRRSDVVAARTDTARTAGAKPPEPNASPTPIECGVVAENRQRPKNRADLEIRPAMIPAATKASHNTKG